MLTREQIFAARLRTVTIDVPDWGGAVLVREMTAFDRVRLAGDDMAKRDVRLEFVRLSCVDDQGVRLFGDDENIGGLGDHAIGLVFAAIRRLNELGGETEDHVEKN